MITEQSNKHEQHEKINVQTREEKKKYTKMKKRRKKNVRDRKT